MPEVGRVSGPSGPLEPGKKDKAVSDSEKFKELMKVQKISETDPEQQKKRKRREEAEDEAIEPEENLPSTPASQVAPFSLTEKETDPSILGVQAPKTTPKPPPSATDSLKATPLPPFSTTPEETSPPEEQESFMETFPSPQSAAPSTPLPTSESLPPSPPPEIPAATGPTPYSSLPPPEIEKTPQIESETSSKKRKVGASMPTDLPQEVKKKRSAPKLKTPQLTAEEKPAREKILPQAKKTLSPRKTPAQESTLEEKNLSSHQKTSPSESGQKISTAEEREAYFKQIKQEKKQIPTDEEATGIIEGVPGYIPPTTPISSVEEKEEKKRIEKEKETAPPSTQMSSMDTPFQTPAELAPPPTTSAPSYAYLHPIVLDVFERMVGVMTVMSTSGITETVMTLNAPQFASSVFYGTQITIQEFSTAPKAYNIQLSASPQAISIFQGNMDDLMAAFQGGKYSFRVNRLDTALLPSDRPLFKRKEGAGGDQPGQNQKGQK